MRNNPREIPNNFRMQPLIEAAYTEAQTHYVTMTDPIALETALLTDMTLAFLEVGEWDKVNQLATALLNSQRQPPISDTQHSTALYALGTRQRELGQCTEALASFNIALQQSSTDSWLGSNILRNVGLVHLKMQQYVNAILTFSAAYQLTEHASDLRGALPALANYLDLCRTLDNLHKQQQTDLSGFEMTAELYQQIFVEKGICDPEEQKQSHDFISHQVHRGQMTIALCEAQPGEEYQILLLDAEYCLSQALEARKRNHADGVRLGDVCIHLGRVYELLADLNKAIKTYKEAVEHYKTVWPDDAEKIVSLEQKICDVTDKLSAKAYVNITRRRTRTASVDLSTATEEESLENTPGIS